MDKKNEDFSGYGDSFGAGSVLGNGTVRGTGDGCGDGDLSGREYGIGSGFYGGGGFGYGIGDGSGGDFGRIGCGICYTIDEKYKIRSGKLLPSSIRFIIDD